MNDLTQENQETNEPIVETVFIQEEPSEFEKLHASLTVSLDKIKTFIHNNDYKDKINKELHEELQLYKNGLGKEITNPLLKNIIHWYDKIMDLYCYYDSEQAKGEEKNELFPRLLKEYKNVATGLLDLLYDYDIEPFGVEPGEDYSPKLHKLIDVIFTEEEDKSKKVAECKKEGFSDISSGRLLRQAEVVIYKMKNNL